jgi:hypothetical protein
MTRCRCQFGISCIFIKLFTAHDRLLPGWFNQKAPAVFLIKTGLHWLRLFLIHCAQNSWKIYFARLNCNYTTVKCYYSVQLRHGVKLALGINCAICYLLHKGILFLFIVYLFPVYRRLLRLRTICQLYNPFYSIIKKSYAHEKVKSSWPYGFFSKPCKPI